MPQPAETVTPPEPMSPSGGSAPVAAQPFPAQVAAIVGSMGRLADLQLAIWLASIKSAMLRIVIFIGLSILVLPLVIAGVIFLYAGLYHVLTDVLRIPTAWS